MSSNNDNDTGSTLQSRSSASRSRSGDRDIIVRVSNLDAGYVNSHIVFGMNFEAVNKEITVIVGPNGCGKSTLLKSIFGITDIYSGEIMYKDNVITGKAPHAIARMKIAYLPQVDNVFSNLTIKENLIMASYTLDSKTFHERLPKIYKIFPVLENRNDRAKKLSGGQRQMLAMAMALIREPETLLFDEPTASLSPKLAAEVLEKIVQIRDEYGITIIIVEQNVRQALKIGDSVYLLANGKNVFNGNAEQLLANKDLGSMYLGIGK